MSLFAFLSQQSLSRLGGDCANFAIKSAGRQLKHFLLVCQLFRLIANRGLEIQI